MRKKNDNALWMTLAVMAWAVFLLTVVWLWLREAPAETQLPALTVELSEAVSEPITEVAAEEPEADAVAVLPEPGWFRREIPLDREIQEALHEACVEFGTYYEVMLALIERETGFVSRMGDGGDSYGLCQIQPRWWDELLSEIGTDNLMDEKQNVRAGCAVMAHLVQTYGDLEPALTAYNTGKPGKSDYADAVLARAEKWRE